MSFYDILLAKKLGGGGGSSVTVEPLSVTQNGTYSETGKAYSPVSVSVPQPSGSTSISENGTYDVTNYAEAVVNVSGGGLELLSEQPLGDISTSSTSEITVGSQFEVPTNGIYRYFYIVAVANTVKTGGYHAATVTLYVKAGNASRIYEPRINYWYTSSGNRSALTLPTGTVPYGIYPSVAASDVKLTITMKAKYSNSYTQTIDNNYTVYVYGVKETDILG